MLLSFEILELTGAHAEYERDLRHAVQCVADTPLHQSHDCAPATLGDIGQFKLFPTASGYSVRPGFDVIANGSVVGRIYFTFDHGVFCFDGGTMSAPRVDTVERAPARAQVSMAGSIARIPSADRWVCKLAFLIDPNQREEILGDMLQKRADDRQLGHAEPAINLATIEEFVYLIPSRISAFRFVRLLAAYAKIAVPPAAIAAIVKLGQMIGIGD
ncbi:MAG: hypothetical protein AAFR38_11140 [Planctomycetota bacterium]